MSRMRSRVSAGLSVCLASVGLAASLSLAQAAETEVRAERGQGPSTFGQISVNPWRVSPPERAIPELQRERDARTSPSPTAAPAPTVVAQTISQKAGPSSLGVDANRTSHLPSGDVAADGLTDQGIPPHSTEKVLYLTIDDGPNRTYTPKLLQLLEKYNAKATWFVVGEEAAKAPEMLTKIRNSGHAIGNHTWSHPWLSKLSTAKVRDQLTHTASIIGGTNCMRPPGGDVNDTVRSVASSLNMRMIMWDVDPFDWKQPRPNAIAATLTKGARPGAILLVHDGGGNRSNTLAALPGVLKALTAKGYRFEAIPGCMVR